MYAWSASRCVMRTSSASTTSTGDSARASNARESSATPAQTGSTVLIDRRGGPRDGPPDPSSERGYAPLGLPRPSLGRAPAQPWRASGLTQDVSSIVVGGPDMAPRTPHRHEDRHARLRPDLARRVTLARQVLSDQDVARPQAAHDAVADLDVDGAGEREHRVTPWRVVPGIRALGLEAAHDDAATGNQLRRLGLVAARLVLGLDVLEVGLAVRARVDADDRHVASSGSRADVTDEPLRRVLAPLAPEPFLRRQEIAAALRVEPVGVRPTLVDAAPRIGPVVVDLAAEQMPPHAPHVVVLAEPRQVLVVLEHGVHVRHLERHVVQPRALVVYAEECVVIDVLVATIAAVERADDVVLVARVHVVRADEPQRLAKPLHGLLHLRRADHTVAHPLDRRGRRAQPHQIAGAAEWLEAAVHVLARHPDRRQPVHAAPQPRPVTAP